ncbi:MAG: hypothetical protein Q7S66_06155 [bacterium]|nr:hypothetical protein [bacterium]
MLGFKISYIRENGKNHLIKGDENGLAELIMLGPDVENLLLVFDFFDPDVSHKPLPEIKIEYSYNVLAMSTAEGQKPKKVFSAFGKKGADERGRVVLEIPLDPFHELEICMDVEIMHVGVGAYRDDSISLDIPIRKGYNC